MGYPLEAIEWTSESSCFSIDRIAKQDKKSRLQSAWSIQPSRARCRQCECISKVMPTSQLYEKNAYPYIFYIGCFNIFISRKTSIGTFF